MSALLHPCPIPNRPALRLVGTAVERPIRPSAAEFRRRRLYAVVVATLSVITLWYAGTALVRVFAGSPAAAAPEHVVSATPVVPTTEQYWTVRPGDTLWSIAQSIHPRGDIRPVVERLQARYGSTPLEVGKSISVS